MATFILHCTWISQIIYLWNIIISQQIFGENKNMCKLFWRNYQVMQECTRKVDVFMRQGVGAAGKSNRLCYHIRPTLHWNDINTSINYDIDYWYLLPVLTFWAWCSRHSGTIVFALRFRAAINSGREVSVFTSLPERNVRAYIYTLCLKVF